MDCLTCSIQTPCSIFRAGGSKERNTNRLAILYDYFELPSSSLVTSFRPGNASDRIATFNSETADRIPKSPCRHVPPQIVANKGLAGDRLAANMRALVPLRRRSFRSPMDSIWTDCRHPKKTAITRQKSRLPIHRSLFGSLGR